MIVLWYDGNFKVLFASFLNTLFPHWRRLLIGVEVVVVVVAVAVAVAIMAGSRSLVLKKETIVGLLRLQVVVVVKVMFMGTMEVIVMMVGGVTVEFVQDIRLAD